MTGKYYKKFQISVGKDEAGGSNPPSSSTKTPEIFGFRVFFAFWNVQIRRVLFAVVLSVRAEIPGDAAVYAEVVARIKRAPATVFYIPALVPMIPGGSLYYTMSYAVRSDWDMVRLYAGNTMYCAVGIAVGLCIVLSVAFTGRKLREAKR